MGAHIIVSRDGYSIVECHGRPVLAKWTLGPFEPARPYDPNELPRIDRTRVFLICDGNCSHPTRNTEGKESDR